MHVFRRLRLRINVWRIRRDGRRHGLPGFNGASDGGVMLGFLANERMKWTRESYLDACLAELPKVRPFVSAREMRGLQHDIEMRRSRKPKEQP